MQAGNGAVVHNVRGPRAYYTDVGRSKYGIRVFASDPDDVSQDRLAEDWNFGKAFSSGSSVPVQVFPRLIIVPHISGVHVQLSAIC